VPPENGNRSVRLVRTGLVIAFPGGNCGSVHNPNPRPPQARRRIEVRISARDGHEPFGRSRPFRLLSADLEELIAVAERMERRA
jgi:hypothetical protein